MKHKLSRIIVSIILAFLLSGCGNSSTSTAIMQPGEEVKMQMNPGDFHTEIYYRYFIVKSVQGWRYGIRGCNVVIGLETSPENLTWSKEESIRKEIKEVRVVSGSDVDNPFDVVVDSSSYAAEGYSNPQLLYWITLLSLYNSCETGFSLETERYKYKITVPK